MAGSLGRDDLHEYQKYSAEFIIGHPVAALFLDCGLGKTVITLTALEELMLDRFEVRKTLVICPLRVGSVWQSEALKWDHTKKLHLSVAIGTASERLSALDKRAQV